MTRSRDFAQGATRTEFIYTATATQTTFSGNDNNSVSLSYTAGQIDVYLNGSRLAPADYTATNGTSVVLGTGADVSDTLQINAFGSFNVANVVATRDLEGNEFVLDDDGDTTITADTDDQIDFKIANTDHMKFLSSSGDTVIQQMTDTKDIIFKQFDGTSVLAINDGAYAEFLGAGIVPEATLTDASTVTWNGLTQSVCKVTLGGNRTIGLASGGVSGAFISILIIQDGSGSRTVTWNAAYEFTGDTAPTLTTTADKGDLFVFRYNGSKWLEVGRNLNLTLS